MTWWQDSESVELCYQQTSQWQSYVLILLHTARPNVIHHVFGNSMVTVNKGSLSLGEKNWKLRNTRRTLFETSEVSTGKQIQKCCYRNISAFSHKNFPVSLCLSQRIWNFYDGRLSCMPPTWSCQCRCVLSPSGPDNMVCGMRLICPLALHTWGTRSFGHAVRRWETGKQEIWSTNNRWSRFKNEPKVPIAVDMSWGNYIQFLMFSGEGPKLYYSIRKISKILNELISWISPAKPLKILIFYLVNCCLLRRIAGSRLEKPGRDVRRREQPAGTWSYCQ